MRISSTLAGIYNDICLTYVYKHMQVGGVPHKLLEISHTTMIGLKNQCIRRTLELN